MARKWCQQSGNQLFVFEAEDTIAGCTLTLPEHYSMAAREKGRGSKKQRKGKDLPWWIYLAKGMKVMVTDNVKMDLDVTNGA